MGICGGNGCLAVAVIYLLDGRTDLVRDFLAPGVISLYYSVGLAATYRLAKPVGLLLGFVHTGWLDWIYPFWHFCTQY